jgi:uncharacterized protein involved in exopolysaccharide biosynthesis
MHPSVNDRPQDEISLRQLFTTLWRGKWLIVAIALVFVALGTTAALLMPKTYRATAILAPSSETGADGRLAAIGSIASQFGLGSLAGLAGSGDAKSAESIAVLQSGALTGRYIAENALLPALFSKQWDPRANRWKVNQAKVPTPWKAVQRFQKIRGVRSDSRTGLVTLTITWTDPELAAAWANGLVKMTNESLRAKAIEESERNIAYLNDQAQKTAVVEGRQTIYKLLEGELNKVMLARGTNEYAFRVLDPAVAPEKPYAPRLTVWVIASFAAGAFFAALLVLIRQSLRQ